MFSGDEYYLDNIQTVRRALEDSSVSAKEAKIIGKDRVIQRLESAESILTKIKNGIREEYAGDSLFVGLKNLLPKCIDGFDCNSKLTKRFLWTMIQDDPSVMKQVPQRFTIVGAGHSSAAAHGNYGNESYHHIMALALGPILSEVGVETAILNTAQGGSDTIPDPMYCWKEVIGDSADVVTWDFGMTECNQCDIRIEEYVRQAARSSQPLLMLFGLVIVEDLST